MSTWLAEENGTPLSCENGNIMEVQVNPYYPVGVDCVLYHAYWDGTAVDHSIYGNGGVVTDAEFTPNGLFFDGSGYVSIDNSLGQLDPGSSDYTLVAWVYGDPLKEQTVVFDFGYNGSTGLITQFLGGIYLWQYTPAWGGVNYNGPLSDLRGVWRMIHWIYDRSAGKGAGYDGNNVTVNQDGAGDFTLPAATCWIGRPDNFGLTLGEVYIFKSLKDETNLTNMYNATKARYGL